MLSLLIEGKNVAGISGGIPERGRGGNLRSRRRMTKKRRRGKRRKRRRGKRRIPKKVK